jgi:hypothetical protein
MNLKKLLIIPSTISSILAGLCLGFNLSFTQAIDTSLAYFCLFFIISFVITWFLNENHINNEKINYQIINGTLPFLMMIAFYFSYSGIASLFVFATIFHVCRLSRVRYDLDNFTVSIVK